jgi:NADP-dependent 3-hydroxy acid dehydrogenase YdfG
MKIEKENPVKKYDTPPYPKQHQDPPGKEDELDPKADHGEKSYKGSGKLIGRKALITGGDSGIGRAVAIAFAREGADVVISYLNEDDDAQETLRLVKEAGRKGTVIPGDISNESHCKKLIEQTVAELGGIDILVNNAAFQMAHESIQDVSVEEWEKTFRVNCFICVKQQKNT